MDNIKKQAEILGLALARNVVELPEGNYIGSTDYIDRVPDSDSVVYGQDKFGRPFVGFLAYLHGDRPEMVVAFKRYTKEDMWVCSHLNIEAGGCEEMITKIIARFAEGREPSHAHETVWTLSPLA
jgi:hypothetical protein